MNQPILLSFFHGGADLKPGDIIRMRAGLGGDGARYRVNEVKPNGMHTVTLLEES